MRIWIINHYAVTPSEVGITRHYHFARQLSLRGHEVMIVAADFNHFSCRHLLLSVGPGQVDMAHEVPFLWIPTPAYLGNTFSRFWNMLVFSWRLLNKKYLPRHDRPDIIIGSTPHLFAAFSAEILARRLKATYVLEIRDLWPETLRDTKRFGRNHPLIKVMTWIERYLYRRAKRIISLLPTAHDYLISHGVLAPRIHFLRSAIDASFMPAKTHSRNERFTVMYAGAHGFANDLETVVAAAKLLQEKGLSHRIRICLIGDGPEKPRLQTLAALEKLTLLEFLDAVPKNEIYAVLEKADACLMLLKKLPVFRFGTAPNKLFDYMVLGKPVIFAVDTSYDPIKKAAAGFSIRPSDPALLAETIDKLSQLSDTALNEMGQNGKDFVLKHHNIVHLGEELETILYEALRA